MKKISRIIFYRFLVGIFLSGCTVATPYVTYHPVIGGVKLPIAISIDASGKVSAASSAPELITPLGTFEIGEARDLGQIFPNAKGTLTVRVDDTEEIYELHDVYQEGEIDINLEPGYYERVRLTKSGNHWLFEVRRTDRGMNDPTSTDLDQSDRAKPKFYDFSSCAEPCDGSNATRTFPQGIKKIYLQWTYENVPNGAHYVRRWTQAGEREWARYDCTWTGDISGIEDKVTLSDPKGLRSGTWEVSILIEDAVVMQEQIEIQGDWDNEDYGGDFSTCYGKTR